jgi:uncharacterized protein (UPF0276 family)
VVDRPDPRLPRQGTGLGLRRGLYPGLSSTWPDLDFLEVAPENWIPLGGRYPAMLEACAGHYPLTCHGLSLSLGGPAPLDMDFLRALKEFLDQYDIRMYSEHLSAASDQGHLYDLMPLPFTEDAIRYVANRIRQVQDMLERPMIIENVSAYVAEDNEMTEPDFVRHVLEEADCLMLLDVNNVYVNAHNFGFSATDYIRAMPGQRIACLHVAGHYDEAPDLKIDTHGADVIDPVWDLLRLTYEVHGIRPTLLERDFNYPPLDTLMHEVRHIRQLQKEAQPGTTG